MAEPKPLSKLEVRTVLGLASIMLLAPVIILALFSNPRGWDFSAMYAGGLIVRQGHGSSLYNLDEQVKTENKIFGEHRITYAHPPFEALLLAPLTRFNYATAYAILAIINVLLWLLFQHVLRPYAPVPKEPHHYILLCSLFFPLWMALLQGQTSVLVLLAFTMTYVHLERGQDYRAGFFLGLGLFKFAFVLPFALICFLRRRWEMAIGFAGAALLLGTLSLISVGPRGIVSYIKLLAGLSAAPDRLGFTKVKPWQMPTLTGFLMTLFAPHTGSRWVVVAGAIAGGILILVTAWLWRRSETGGNKVSMRMMFAAALVVSLIASPYLYKHDLTLMLLAILLVLGSPERQSQPVASRILIGCTAVLYFAPLYLILINTSKLSLLCPVLLCFALAILLMAARRIPETENSTTVTARQSIT